MTYEEWLKADAAYGDWLRNATPWDMWCAVQRAPLVGDDFPDVFPRVSILLERNQ